MARPGIKPTTSDLWVRCPTDCATRPGDQVWPWPSTYLNKCFKCHCYSSRRTTVPNYFETNAEVMAPTNSIYDHFLIWPSSVTLTFNLSEQMFQITLLLLQEKQLCCIIFKSMHKCKSYGRDKLNLWPFHHLTFKSDLNLPTTWTNVSNGTSVPQGKQLCHIILKSMHKCTSFGPDRCTHIHIHITEFATTMSRSPQARSTKRM